MRQGLTRLHMTESEAGAHTFAYDWEWGRGSHVWRKRQLSFPSTGNLFKQASGQLQQSSLPVTRQLLAWTGCSLLLDLCDSKYCLLPLHLSLRPAKFVSSLFRLHSPISNIPAWSSKSKSLCDKQINKYTEQSPSRKQFLSWLRNSTNFMGTDSSLPPSQQLAIFPYPEPDKSSPRSPILCLKIHFNTFPLCTQRSTK